MTSDINQDKVRVAIDWINKLAQGMNPIDGSILPDNDIVNNVHISRGRKEILQPPVIPSTARNLFSFPRRSIPLLPQAK